MRELIETTTGTVVIADCRLEKAREMRAALGGRAEAAFVDAEDESSLLAVLQRADAAVGCIGPFYRHGVQVAGAAVEAGANYVDVCDDYGPVRELLDLDEAARERGVTLITGLGWTPGLTNLLARKGAAELDEIDEVRIAWTSSSADSTGLSVIEHVFYVSTGDVPTYRGGEWVSVPARSEPEAVTFPEPLGLVQVSHCGHPEPLTIPRYIPARTVSLKGALIPDWNNRMLALFARLSLIGTPRKNARMARLIHAIEGIFRIGGVACSGARVDVSGVQDGEPRTASFAVADTLGKITGIPAAIGARWLAEGRLPKGAYAPEGCLDPDPFLEELAWRRVRYQRLS